MDFNEYQQAAAKTAIYPQRMAVVYPTLGLAGETGEVAEKVKKTFRDNEGNFDINYLANVAGVKPADIQELIKFGYFERDIQTYGKGLSPRQMLALKFNDEIEKLNRRRNVTTYGGKIYKRGGSE